MSEAEIDRADLSYLDRFMEDAGTLCYQQVDKDMLRQVLASPTLRIALAKAAVQISEGIKSSLLVTKLNTQKGISDAIHKQGLAEGSALFLEALFDFIEESENDDS